VAAADVHRGGGRGDRDDRARGRVLDKVGQPEMDTAELFFDDIRLPAGTPIGSFQHTKFLLAELITKIDVARAYVDAAVGEHAGGTLSPVDAAKAKWWSAQVQNEVLDHCVQIHGGYGYLREYRAARAWMDARVTKIWAGTNEIMKELIGRDLGL
jgi:long-chain-acyl-CoA dehydrogenase